MSEEKKPDPVDNALEPTAEMISEQAQTAVDEVTFQATTQYADLNNDLDLANELN